MVTKRSVPRIISLLLLFVMTLSFAACGGKVASSGGASSGTVLGNNTPAAEPEFVMKIGLDAVVGALNHVSAEYIKEEIEKNSNGRIAVEVYPAQQLGSVREMIEGMQLGSVEAVLVPISKFAGFDARLNLCDMPMLFRNEDILWQMLEGEVGQRAMANLPDIGLLGVQYYAGGFKIITANKPIKTPEDMRGQKIRTMESPIIMSMFAAWGANPVPIDFAEVYNSLQQRVVDGQENPIYTIYDMKYYEVNSYMMFLEHACLTNFLCYSESWFNSLPQDLQEVVWNAGLDGAQYQKEVLAKFNEEYLKSIEEYGGVEYIYFTDEEKQLWIDAVQPVYAEYRDEIGGDLLDFAIAEADRLYESQ